MAESARFERACDCSQPSLSGRVPYHLGQLSVIGLRGESRTHKVSGLSRAHMPFWYAQKRGCGPWIRTTIASFKGSRPAIERDRNKHGGRGGTWPLPFDHSPVIGGDGRTRTSEVETSRLQRDAVATVPRLQTGARGASRTPKHLPLRQADMPVLLRARGGPDRSRTDTPCGTRV